MNDPPTSRAAGPPVRSVSRPPPLLPAHVYRPPHAPASAVETGDSVGPCVTCGHPARHRLHWLPVTTEVCGLCASRGWGWSPCPHAVSLPAALDWPSDTVEVLSPSRARPTRVRDARALAALPTLIRSTFQIPAPSFASGRPGLMVPVRDASLEAGVPLASVPEVFRAPVRAREGPSSREWVTPPVRAPVHASVQFIPPRRGPPVTRMMSWRQLGVGEVYCGRGTPGGLAGSKWQNVYPVHETGGRDSAIEAYAEFLLAAGPLLGMVVELSGCVLRCHCTLDEACHCQVLIEAWHGLGPFRARLAAVTPSAPRDLH